MKRQRNTTQMKEQTRNTEVQINKEEIGKLVTSGGRVLGVTAVADTLEKAIAIANALMAMWVMKIVVAMF